MCALGSPRIEKGFGIKGCCSQSGGYKLGQGGSPQARGASREALRRPVPSGLNPGAGRGLCMGMEIAPFSQIKPLVPRPPVSSAHSLCRSPQTWAGGFLGSQREVSFQSRAGQRESRAFFSAAHRPAAWPPRGAAFRDAGLGRSKGRQIFSPAFTPCPRAPRREFQLWATSCPHVEFKHPGHSVPAGPPQAAASD